MLNEAEFSDSMMDIGYYKVAPHVFKSLTPSEVEHFLYLSFWGRENGFLSVDYGIRNILAETFSLSYIKMVGGNAYKTIEKDLKYSCKMRFSLGRISGWKPRWSLSNNTQYSHTLCKKIIDDTETYLLPVIKTITSLSTLSDMLINDDELFKWIYVNSAIRAAQFIFIEKNAGTAENIIFDKLMPFERSIMLSLGRNKFDLRRFISICINDIAIFYMN